MHPLHGNMWIDIDILKLYHYSLFLTTYFPFFGIPSLVIILLPLNSFFVNSKWVSHAKGVFQKQKESWQQTCHAWTLWWNSASPRFQEYAIRYLLSRFRVRTLGRSRGITESIHVVTRFSNKETKIHAYF